MLRIGQFNNLAVIHKVEYGFYLDSRDDQWGDVLLPLNSAPKGCSIGDNLDVFIYFDSEDRITATTKRPHIMVGQFNLLRVASMETVGALNERIFPK